MAEATKLVFQRMAVAPLRSATALHACGKCFVAIYVTPAEMLRRFFYNVRSTVSMLVKGFASRHSTRICIAQVTSISSKNSFRRGPVDSGAQYRWPLLLDRL